ncbi:MAG: hypothetical protein Q9169_002105 [Polycauliona sp. 2 TL-2023]
MVSMNFPGRKSAKSVANQEPTSLGLTVSAMSGKPADMVPTTASILPASKGIFRDPNLSPTQAVNAFIGHHLAAS